MVKKTLHRSAGIRVGLQLRMDSSNWRVAEKIYSGWSATTTVAPRIPRKDIDFPLVPPSNKPNSARLEIKLN
jgi:hypothetical protein